MTQNERNAAINNLRAMLAGWLRQQPPKIRLGFAAVYVDSADSFLAHAITALTPSHRRIYIERAESYFISARHHAEAGAP